MFDNEKLGLIYDVFSALKWQTGQWEKNKMATEICQEIAHHFEGVTIGRQDGTGRNRKAEQKN